MGCIGLLVVCGVGFRSWMLWEVGLFFVMFRGLHEFVLVFLLAFR